MLRLRDIMARDVITVPPDLPLRDAMELLGARHVSGAPVVANGRIVGVVSLTDLVAFAASTPGAPTRRDDVVEWGEFENQRDVGGEDNPGSAFFADLWDDSGADVVTRMSQTDGPEWNALEDHTVADAMNRSIVALRPDLPVEDAAELMRVAAIHRVLVVDDGRLVGIVSTRDISDAVANGRITNRVYVFGSAAARRGD